MMIELLNQTQMERMIALYHENISKLWLNVHIKKIIPDILLFFFHFYFKEFATA